MAKVESKFSKLGLTPPGDGQDLDRVYSESVQNLIRQQQEAAHLLETAGSDDMRAMAQENSDRVTGMLDLVTQTDLTAALAAIEDAASYPQHVAAVGQEPSAPEEG
jgi:hypothetical protein